VNRLKWTVLATHVPPGGSLGGVVRYTTELIKALAARDDLDVSVVTTRPAADTIAELLGTRAAVSAWPNAPVPLLSIVERHGPLAQLRRRPDVIHGTKHLVPARTTAFRVLTVHDMLLMDRAQDFGLAKRVLLPPSYRGSIRDSDLLLCVSEATRQRLDHHVPGAARRAEVVHLATSQTLRAAVAREVEVLRGRPFALVVGDASPRKNLATVVRAWSEVRRQVPDAVLAMVGPPSWGRTEVGPTYTALVGEGAIRGLGHVDDAELRWLYENCQVTLCPSLAEGFGLPAAEALQFGAPLIISDDAALQEVAGSRALAVLAPLSVTDWSAAIVKAMGRPRQGQDPVPDRSWSDVAADSVNAVTSALSLSGRRESLGRH
jgi:glycosyltransferase involved in cell wall biosynthesis